MSIDENVKLLKDKYSGNAPIALAFRTLDKQYVYDTATGKVIACKEIEYKIIERIILNQFEQIGELEETYGTEEVSKALDAIMNCITDEHILEVVKFKTILTDPDYIVKVTSKQEQLMLELTERCNLRCIYCIYHGGYDTYRNFGIKDMSEEIAFKAIDAFKKNSSVTEDVSITFYGGEPLLKFDLMKKCIEYAKKIFENKPLRFGFTTNLTLVTPEIAEYLAGIEDMRVTGSLDGPQNVHDSYRVDVNGKGTFLNAIRGLKYLAEAFRERNKQCLDINIVYSPPYNKNKLNEIERFFNELSWLPKEVAKSISYVEDNTLPEEVMKQAAMAEDYTVLDRAKEKIGTPDYTNSIVTQTYKSIYNSPMFEEAVDTITLNACCVPGHRRLYVTVDGNYKMCERVGEVPYIGNVNEGINVEFIRKEYLDDYAEKSYEDCSTCWTARLCNVCYSHCYEKDTMSISKKRKQCHDTKEHMAQSFCHYYELLEKEPERLKYLEDIILV